MVVSRLLSTGPSLTARLLSGTISTARPAMLQVQGVQIQPARTRVYYSRTMGKPRTVRAVIKRFFRLNNGQWIRTQAGRAKRLWKKEPRQQARLKQHLCLNATQCRKLDKMVNRRWKEKSFHVDDPYEPYHKLERIPHYSYKPPKFLP
ncbi:hypothetical protein NP493_761g00002 [Ridgeia piscesae]|uniref:Large ribosomal subunit protein bL35m n=1 Tax=Ridgeia piscesae TaxID=27915 RepID=A0AAD9NNJ2_RIDPI|nr:hypothetical protein NP493_761g00002 [Ridgeia piscesae]